MFTLHLVSSDHDSVLMKNMRSSCYILLHNNHIWTHIVYCTAHIPIKTYSLCLAVQHPTSCPLDFVSSPITTPWCRTAPSARPPRWWCQYHLHKASSLKSGSLGGRRLIFSIVSRLNICSSPLLKTHRVSMCVHLFCAYMYGCPCTLERDKKIPLYT